MDAVFYIIMASDPEALMDRTIMAILTALI